MLAVRAAGLADSAEIARLNRLFNGVDESGEQIAARLADDRRVDTPILAELDGQAVGLANLRLLQPLFYPEPYAELTELFVVEEARRQGVGRALVNFVEALARQAGANELILLTDFDNDTALRFYFSLGFVHHDLALAKRLV